MARKQIQTVLSAMGGRLDDDGSVLLPECFFVDELRTHFGVFSVNERNRATYRLKSLSDVEMLHTSKSDAFSRDVMHAAQSVRNGSGRAIIMSAMYNGDAFTQLCLIPR